MSRRLTELITMSSLSLSDQIVVSGSSFLTMVFVSRFCTKEEVGIFALCWSVINMARTIQERAIAAPYIAFAPTHAHRATNFRGSSIVHNLGLSGFILAAIIVSLFAFILLDVPTPTVLVTASLAISIPLILFRDQFRAIISSEFLFTQLIKLDTAIAVIQLGSIAWLGWMGWASLFWIITILGISCLIPCGIWFYKRRRDFSFRRTEIIRDWLSNWDYSRWLLSARFFGVFGYLAGPWLVWYFLDSAATGAFAICSSLVGISLTMVNGLNNYFQPKAIKTYREQGSQALVRDMVESSFVLVLLLMSISIAFFFAGGWLLSMIYGPSYEPYGFVAFLLTLSTLVVSLSILFSNGLAALGDSKKYFWGEFACFIVLIVSALILIPTFELNGAALAQILGGTAASIVAGWMLWKGIESVPRQNFTPDENNQDREPAQVGKEFHRV